MTRNPDQQIWEQMLAYLRREYPPLCRQWFEEIDPVGLHNGTLRLRTQSDVHRNYLRRHCLDAFNDAVRSVTSQLISVRFQGDEDDGPAVEVHSESQEGLDRSDALSINPDYTFDHFIVGPENRLA
ncbi:MAG: hypothetical protein KDA28_04200, partial [Phycisphaerales bacterium]|nr:hypothetical protein [Phycisphaerales bacterium]